MKELLFEIGVEEMPSSPLNNAIAQLERIVPQKFKDANIGFESFEIEATPRRIVLAMQGVTEAQPDEAQSFRGPAKRLGVKEDGSFSPAALGFARSKGISPEELIEKDVDGQIYLFAETLKEGRPSTEVLPEILSSLIDDIDWPKSMHWGESKLRFIRPLRWILAIFGGETLEMSYGELKASNLSYGHRFMNPELFEVSSFEQYKQELSNRHVVLSQKEREQVIRREIDELSSPYGEALIDERVLSEVINLTEFPNVLVGCFDKEFLSVPKEIILSALSTHQRYFAISKTDGTLDNHFLVVSNGDPAKAKGIIAGHEKVVLARLHDASFFVAEDSAVSLEEWKEKLKQVVFQQKLGTTYQKVERIERLSDFIAHELNLSGEQIASIKRGASLSKSDLVTSAVIEFPELQGIMGSHYALADGEDPLVAQIIKEHYMPRFADDLLPTSVEAKVVALADKIDTIAGIFAIGRAPKGTSDPFAIRRSAIGILRILEQVEKLDLFALIAKSTELYKEQGLAPEVSAIQSFFIQRFERILKEKYPYDSVDAVISHFDGNPYDTRLRAAALSAFRHSQEKDSENLFAAYKRALNLCDESVGTKVDASLLSDTERALVDRITQSLASTAELISGKEYKEALEVFATLRKPLDDFFEAVMVLDPNEDLRRNRLAILNNLVKLFARFADFSKIAQK